MILEPSSSFEITTWLLLTRKNLLGPKYLLVFGIYLVHLFQLSIIVTIITELVTVVIHERRSGYPDSLPPLV